MLDVGKLILLLYSLITIDSFSSMLDVGKLIPILMRFIRELCFSSMLDVGKLILRAAPYPSK